jgi:hypothetical protein
VPIDSRIPLVRRRVGETSGCVPPNRFSRRTSKRERHVFRGPRPRHRHQLAGVDCLARPRPRRGAGAHRAMSTSMRGRSSGARHSPARRRFSRLCGPGRPVGPYRSRRGLVALNAAGWRDGSDLTGSRFCVVRPRVPDVAEHWRRHIAGWLQRVVAIDPRDGPQRSSWCRRVGRARRPGRTYGSRCVRLA